MKITKQHLSPLEEYSWKGNTQKSIMLHTTLGNSYQGAYETLKIRHLSYHYIIDEDGTIRELIPIDRSAWHAGVKSKPNLRVRAFFGADNPNKHSIGISFVRNGHSHLTNKQRDAGVWLIKEIGKKTGIRYNRDNIFAHYEVTNYKPYEVFSPYRTQIMEGLEGYKDEKDAKEKTILQLRIQILLLQIKLLKKKLGIT